MDVIEPLGEVVATSNTSYSQFKIGVQAEKWFNVSGVEVGG